MLYVCVYLYTGAVVGVAFGMLIAGMLLASLTVIGIKQLKKKPAEDMQSKLTEHELS